MENKTQSKTYPKPKYSGFYNKVIKRIIGLLIAGIALMILWPFYLIIALAISIVIILGALYYYLPWIAEQLGIG